MKLKHLILCLSLVIIEKHEANACFFSNFYKEKKDINGQLVQTYDMHGRTLQDILKFNHEELEETHDFIQTLFPTSWQGMDEDTLPISNEDVQVFLKRPDLRDKVFESFKLMAEFYGYRIIPFLKTGYIVRGENFDQRVDEWAFNDNHNLRRIRRILCSLSLLGLPGVSKEFYHALVTEIPPYSIAQETIKDWKACAGL